MTYSIERVVTDQATRSIRRHELLVYRTGRDQKKRAKRTGKKLKLARNEVPRWRLDQQFNPFYVRKKASSISHAIESAIQSKTYTPRPSVDLSIKKKGGGRRKITVYTVPDAAVGSWLRERLQVRNSGLLSKYAFAYRTDKNVNDALKIVADRVALSPRVFVAEFDFAKFFDSIDHSYLLATLKRNFQIRTEELAVLRALLAGKSARESEYKTSQFTKRKAGIPQGNTISLFLANAVCFELDRALESTGVTFARYADDIVVLTRSYYKACKAADVILRWSAESKVGINYGKSDGISLLIPQGTAEIKSKNSITFLGCEISQSGVRPAQGSLARLKTKIARVIYQHLVQAPRKRTFSKKRIQPEADWDLVTCINEIRRLLYGRLTEGDLAEGLNGDAPLRSVRSHMSGFAMVDDPQRFRDLDGWMVGVLERACAERAALVARLGVKPLNLSRKRLIAGDWYTHQGFAQTTKLPSSFRIWLYIRKYYRSRGIRALPAPLYDY